MEPCSIYGIAGGLTRKLSVTFYGFLRYRPRQYRSVGVATWALHGTFCGAFSAAWCTANCYHALHTAQGGMLLYRPTLAVPIVRNVGAIHAVGLKVHLRTAKILLKDIFFFIPRHYANRR